jgi:hypothetical protein
MKAGHKFKKYGNVKSLILTPHIKHDQNRQLRRLKPETAGCCEESRRSDPSAFLRLAESAPRFIFVGEVAQQGADVRFVARKGRGVKSFEESVDG